MKTTIVVQSCPGREEMTRRTVVGLDGYGGARDVAAPRVLYWTGIAGPGFDLPTGWVLFRSMREPEGHRRDLWRLMADVVGDDDLLFFEDDMIPCRNAVTFAAGLVTDHFTTFCNLRGVAPGVHAIDPKMGFWGTCAVRIPARLVGRMVTAGPDGKRKWMGQIHGGDTRMSDLLVEWGEPVNYTRSIFQHVGADSICRPGAKLRGLRAPARDFDPELDAMTLNRPAESP